jgi:hypothetical protein
MFIAFGIFARSLPSSPEFADLSRSLSGIDLADSIAGDGHKMLNVVRTSNSHQNWAIVLTHN